MQVGDDGRQRGRDDRLVERGQEHPQHERADDDQHATMAQGGDLQAIAGGGRFVGHRRGVLSLAFTGVAFLTVTDIAVSETRPLARLSMALAVSLASESTPPFALQ